MGRGKNKKRQPQTIQINELEIENRVEIDYDKLAQAIVKTNQLSKEEEKAAIENAKKEIIANRMKALGEKDFSHIKNGIWRSIRTTLNKAKVFLRLLFVPKEIAKNLSAVDSLFKLIASLFFGVVRMVLYLIMGCFVIFTFVHKMPILLLYGVSIFILAQLVRIAQIEVEHMEDRGYLMAISGTIIAIASLVVAILSEFEVI